MISILFTKLFVVNVLHECNGPSWWNVKWTHVPNCWAVASMCQCDALHQSDLCVTIAKVGKIIFWLDINWKTVHLVWIESHMLKRYSSGVQTKKKTLFTLFYCTNNECLICFTCWGIEFFFSLFDLRTCAYVRSKYFQSKQMYIAYAIN